MERSLHRTYLSPSGFEMFLVDSSNIHAIGHNHHTSIMEIHFNNGNVYSYRPITNEGFKVFLNSSSKGEFFRKHIREDKTITTTKENFTIDPIKTKEMAKSKVTPEKDEVSLELMENTFKEFKENYTRFSEKGIKKSGTRARKVLLDLGKIVKGFRIQILNQQKADK